MVLLGPSDAAELLLSTVNADEISRYDRTLWRLWVETWLATADETWPLNVGEVLDHIEAQIRTNCVATQSVNVFTPSAEHP